MKYEEFVWEETGVYEWWTEKATLNTIAIRILNQSILKKNVENVTLMHKGWLKCISMLKGCFKAA